jgi:hypothetical protein
VFIVFRPTFRITHPKTVPDELEVGYRAGRGFWVAVYALFGHLHSLERQRTRLTPTAPVKPEFALHITLLGMDMDGFASFIGVEEQAPPEQQKNSRHMQANPFLRLTRSSAEPVEREQNRLRLEHFAKRFCLLDSKPRK